ncbi:MAG TPA: hypothetical protein VGK19_16185 [Capsulimonadaceae bacterium]|jgi:antitoxin (DNA-binding transcriptional repressor) of toxin-antitoxin stability system
MTTISVEELEATPHDFVEQLKTGGEIIITIDSKPLARVSSIRPTAQDVLFGSLAGKMRISDDFNEPLNEFYEGE